MTLSTRFQNAIRALRGADFRNSADSVKSQIMDDSRSVVNADTAKNCSTVFSCVRIISDAVASLPLKTYIADETTRNVDKSSKLYPLLAYAPCPWMDKFAYWKFNINCLLLRGMFASIIVRNSKGEVIQLIPVNPSYIDTESTEQRPDGTLIFKIRDKYGAVKNYTQDQLFFCYYETLDGITPVSPLKFAKQTIGLANNAEKYGLDTLKKGAVLPGYYSTDKPIGDNAYTRLKKDLSEFSMGDNSGRSPLLEDGLKYNTVSMTAEDMQMLETRRYQKEEICGIYGVPPHLIGDVAQAKGWSTMEQTMTEFLQLSLVPVMTRIENAITTRLIPEKDRYSKYAKFSVDGLLRGDMTARTNYYRTMHQIGAYNANETRAKEEMNPIEGGDTYYIPANMTPVKTNGVENGL